MLTHLQWYIGRELNPSLGSFDIKSFNELRPGLILWVLLNLSFACEQAVRRGGSLANVTDSMWLVLAFQTWYVMDGLFNEVRFHFPSPMKEGVVSSAPDILRLHDSLRFSLRWM